jgi:hypothetical protein
LRVFLIIVAVLVRALSAEAAGETVIRELKNTKIIRSQESPHNILNDACVACHPKDKYDFWLLIYKGKPPQLSIERPEEKGTAGTPGDRQSKGPVNRFNSHDSLVCNFCHFDNPTSSSPRFIVEVQDLCRLCHPASVNHRMPEGKDLEKIDAAISSGKLPGKDGKILCTTCHKLHDSTYGVREAYVQILWKDRIPNPHGERSLCFACHPGRIREGTEVRFATGKDNIRLCNECHLREGVKRESHVVDVTSSEGTWRMDYLGYPLNQGKLICSSCHDEVSHGKRDPANPNFLRGGPYANPDKFCYRCHLEDKDQLNNPHRQVDPFGRIREETCRFCHKNAPNPEKPGASDKVMVADESLICMNCHQIRVHPGADHLVRITPVMASRKEEYEKRHKVVLPLKEDGFIKCSTCHNPHAKGVLKGEAGVGAGSRWRVPDFREMCAPCHGRY